MTAFTPPDHAEWCPDCQRDRLNCRHQDDSRAVTDGGEPETPVDAVEHVKDAHRHVLGLGAAAADNDPETVSHHADALREAVKGVEDAVAGGDHS